eukprot:27277_1
MATLHKLNQIKLLENNKQLQNDIKSLNETGYIMIKNVLTSKDISLIKQESLKLLSNVPYCYDIFNGKHTKRTDGFLSKTRIFDKLLLYNRLNNIYDYYFLPNHLLSTLQLIQIFPNSPQQPLHIDSGSYTFASKRPRKHPLRLAVLWAIDDFTETNGATVIYPKSHLWSTGRYPTEKDKFIKAIMPSGSCVIYLGTVFHCGGANTSNKPRLAITTQQIQPWIRAQENFTLSTPLRIVPKLHSKIQSMIGFSIHPPGHGHVFGQNPKDVIEEIMTMNKYSKL